jgi:hypothetical protein
MKMKNSRDRALSFPTRLFGTTDDHHPNSFGQPSASGPRGGHPKMIFIIRQTRALPATNASRKKMRRVLIFDNHPATLRLLFGRRTDPHVDLSAPQRASARELILILMLMVGLLIAMFWPFL